MTDNEMMKTTPCPRCMFGTMYWKFVQGEPADESTGAPDNYRGECENCGLVKWHEQPQASEKLFDGEVWLEKVKGTW